MMRDIVWFLLEDLILEFYNLKEDIYVYSI